MVIFNTTYHVARGLEDQFINWLRETYLPMALKSEYLSLPRLSQVQCAEEQEGSSFSLQFHVKDRDILSVWYNECGENLSEALYSRFGEQVLGYVTLLDEIDI